MEDKVAIITGAGRGLDKAFTLRFAEERAKLILPDINLEIARKTAELINIKGGESIALEADISDEDSTLMIAEKVISHSGKVDILLKSSKIDEDQFTTS